ncbi:hypothetical protein [Aliiglaciecola lipolytica]|uniref:RecBCD enzyme subunit RecD N-terminal domain-containing protein n=1 Tax=Aliiglaciecola lipolytica E3 TaxID=1127673 RepID=K6X0H7_9ALTE|nr:hypothetical protein [Aliiglaciecola lipolytica]GAC14184.1 hypothetical protein GLIP_1550 [Aliiglaciecola lipolytica E3]
MVTGLLDKHFLESCEQQMIRLGFTALDRAFASFIYQQENQHKDKLALLAGIISQRLGQQHSCLNLSELDSLQLRLLGFSNIQDVINTIHASHSIALADADKKINR